MVFTSVEELLVLGRKIHVFIMKFSDDVRYIFCFIALFILQHTTWRVFLAAGGGAESNRGVAQIQGVCTQLHTVLYVVHKTKEVLQVGSRIC
jgi:hypothetical protein